MAVVKTYRQHLTSSNDLVISLENTTADGRPPTVERFSFIGDEPQVHDDSYEAVRAGFVALALEKNRRRATPFVAQARVLKAFASKVKTPAELIDVPEIQTALLTAAGISDKAVAHLQPQENGG